MNVCKIFSTTKVIWAALLFVAVFAASAHAQSTFGSVVGTVQDATNAVVPGAAVTLHSQDDNSDRVTTSSSTGDFQFVNLNRDGIPLLPRLLALLMHMSLLLIWRRARPRV
jgi:hypothetical protein